MGHGKAWDAHDLYIFDRMRHEDCTLAQIADALGRTLCGVTNRSARGVGTYTGDIVPEWEDEVDRIMERLCITRKPTPPKPEPPDPPKPAPQVVRVEPVPEIERTVRLLLSSLHDLGLTVLDGWSIDGDEKSAAVTVRVRREAEKP